MSILYFPAPSHEGIVTLSWCIVIVNGIERSMWYKLMYVFPTFFEGLIHEGDELKEVNGISLEHRKPKEILPLLVSLTCAVQSTLFSSAL